MGLLNYFSMPMAAQPRRLIGLFRMLTIHFEMKRQIILQKKRKKIKTEYWEHFPLYETILKNM